MTPSVSHVIRYDDVIEGQIFPDVTFQITPLLVHSYGVLFDDASFTSVAADAANGSVVPIADPSMLILFGILRSVLRGVGQPPPGGVLARQFYSFDRPLVVPSQIKVSPSIAKKYHKRGRRYVHLHCKVVDDDGNGVGVIDSHVVWAS